MKRNDGDLPVPLEGLADRPVTRARALKLLGATATAGAFAAFAGGAAEARPNKKRRRRRRRRLRARRRRQANITSPQQTVSVGAPGGTPVGATSPPVNVPVTNEGDTTVTIRPEVAGDGFTLVNPGDITLRPGETAQIPVTFTPTVGDVGNTSTGELRVVDANDGLLLETVDLTADAVAAP